MPKRVTSGASARLSAVAAGVVERAGCACRRAPGRRRSASNQCELAGQVGAGAGQRAGPAAVVRDRHLLEHHARRLALAVGQQRAASRRPAPRARPARGRARCARAGRRRRRWPRPAARRRRSPTGCARSPAAAASPISLAVGGGAAAVEQADQLQPVRVGAAQQAGLVVRDADLAAPLPAHADLRVRRSPARASARQRARRCRAGARRRRCRRSFAPQVRAGAQRRAAHRDDHRLLLAAVAGAVPVHVVADRVDRAQHLDAPSPTRVVLRTARPSLPPRIS